MQAWEDKENEKYSALYSSGYPSGSPRQAVTWASCIREASVLDIGCGKGVLSAYFKDYTGTDISEWVIEDNIKRKLPGHYYNVPISETHELQAEGVPYDYAICLDVLEHIPETHVHKTLMDLAKIDAECYLFSINTRPSKFLDKDGGGLHLTVWTKVQWVLTLGNYFHVIEASAVGPNKTFHCLLKRKA